MNWCALLFSIVFLISMYYGTTYAHEMAHAQINKYFGVSSTITISFFEQSTTQAESHFKTPEDYRMAYFLHGLNDAVIYSIAPFLGAILWCLSYLTFDKMLEVSD